MEVRSGALGGEGACSARLIGYTRAAGDVFESYLDCWSDPDDADLNVCQLGAARAPDPDVPRVLVLGDSHARVLLGAFRRLDEQGVLEVDAAAKASCGWSTLPVLDRKDPSAARCATSGAPS